MRRETRQALPELPRSSDAVAARRLRPLASVRRSIFMSHSLFHEVLDCVTLRALTTRVEWRRVNLCLSPGVFGGKAVEDYRSPSRFARKEAGGRSARFWRVRRSWRLTTWVERTTRESLVGRRDVRCKSGRGLSQSKTRTRGSWPRWASDISKRSSTLITDY